MMTTIWT